MMKNLVFLCCCLLIALISYSQNNAPIAVNDTIYIAFNDSTYIQQTTGYPFLINDSDPDGDQIFIDTASYNGLGFFEDTLWAVNPTFRIWRVNYIPPLNFYGLDSILYVIEDNGNPIMYDTAIIYLKVKRQEFEFLDLNNINARFGLNSLFNDVVNGIVAFEVPKGSGTNTMYAANLWIAGKNQDSVYLDAVNYASLSPSTLTEFVSRSGPIMDSMYYQQYDYKWDRLWKISSNEINYHINNWQNAGYQPIEVIANWPAHGDTAKGQAFYLAPFVDNNGDGRYNPYDGDYPKIKGQQAIYFIYHDKNFSEGYSGGPALNSETHYMAYAYNCPSDSAINNTLFVDYTIYNRSNLTYDSTYVGFWADFDIGNPTDDYVGCDVARSTFYGKNADIFDENANGAFGYGDYPPAQGVTFLQGAQQDNDAIDNPFTQNIQDVIDSNGTPYAGLGTGFGDGITDNEHWGMEHFMYYSTSAQFSGGGDPQNSNDYYNYLKGFWRDNTQMVWGGNGHISGGGTIPTKHLFPGITDPLWYGTSGIATTPTNWSEFNEGNPPGDRRGLGSTGPITFYPDSSISITLAFVFGRDYQTTGNQAGIVVMQERIDSIRSYYLTDFVSACGGTIDVNEQTATNNSLLVYPNPFNNELTINYKVQNKLATLEIYDLLGEKVKTNIISNNTTLLNLSNLAKGIYFIKVIDGNNFVTQKIIKQ